MNMESLRSMSMHLNRVNIDYCSYNYSRTPINLINVSDKSIGCAMGSGHRILVRDPNNWVVVQPLACIEGELNMEGEFSLVQWN